MDLPWFTLKSNDTCRLSLSHRSLSVEKRDDLVSRFIQGTIGYWENKRHAERRSGVVQWALQQVPLIELELDASNAAGNRPDRDGRSRKRRRDNPDGEQDTASKQSYRDDNHDTKTRPLKRTRCNSKNTIGSDHKPSNSTQAISIGGQGTLYGYCTC